MAACKHCNKPMPDDAGEAAEGLTMCSVKCAVDAGGFVEGATHRDVVATYVEELLDAPSPAAGEADEYLGKITGGIARLLRFLADDHDAEDIALRAALDRWLLAQEIPW